MANREALIEYLLREDPIPTVETLSKHLSGDERGRTGIGHVPIENIKEVSKTLASEIIFRPFEGVYRVKIGDAGRFDFPHGIIYIFDLDPVLTIVKKDWTLSLSLYPRYLYGEQPSVIFRPEIGLDRYGRFHIPKYMRKIARIGKNAIVVGANDQVIITDESKYIEFITK